MPLLTNLVNPSPSRSSSYNAGNPVGFALNPTLLSTSTSTNNIAWYGTANAIYGSGSYTGTNFGLPVAGTIGYTVQSTFVDKHASHHHHLHHQTHTNTHENIQILNIFLACFMFLISLHTNLLICCHSKFRSTEGKFFRFGTM